jgi:hypothetical protein
VQSTRPARAHGHDAVALHRVDRLAHDGPGVRGVDACDDGVEIASARSGATMSTLRQW